MINLKIGEEDRRISLESQPGNGVSKASCPLWTVDDVSNYLKLQPETIRSMARRGELPAVKFGKVWRFEKAAIDDLLVNRE